MSPWFVHFALHNGDAAVSQNRDSGNSGGRRGGRGLQSQGSNLSELAKEQALELAIEAGVVWPGLTSMVCMDYEWSLS